MSPPDRSSVKQARVPEPPREEIHPAEARAPATRRWWWVAAGVAAAIVAVLLIRARFGAHAQPGGQAASSAEGAGARAGARGSGGGNAADRPVPVLTATAAARDVPITLEGLGSVTAYKTVNVHPQVDGRLIRVDFREGQTVKTGELLAEIDPRPFQIQLHQAQAALARDQAQLHGAQRNLVRYQDVVTQQLIPQQQVDDQRAMVEQLQGSVQSDQAQIESARLQLDYARIKSPIDGVTGVRQVDPGNVVHASDANGIVVVTQLDPIAVIFTLSEDDLPRVARAQAGGALVVDALSRDGNQPLGTGKLEVVDNQINQTTATIRLKAIFPNPPKPQYALWPNQFVKARLRLAMRKGVLVIPAVAVQRGPQGTFVYVVGSDEKAAVRPITIDVLQGDDALLAKGVQPGEAVVIEGQNQLRPGARVAMRAPASGKP
ncbi:MAG TPA: efflux RND transporter periplasmic adaptor subunit [Polyangia bacterium]|nr:efflux RND transporter periplasmic adaptor subunit [Polyangia bacterium]